MKGNIRCIFVKCTNLVLVGYCRILPGYRGILNTRNGTIYFGRKRDDKEREPGDGSSASLILLEIICE